MSARLTCSCDRSRSVGDYRAAHLADNGWVASQGNPSFRMQHKPKKFQPMQRMQSHRSLGFQLPAVNQNQEHEVSHHLWINQWNIILVNCLTELFKHPVEAGE